MGESRGGKDGTRSGGAGPDPARRADDARGRRADDARAAREARDERMALIPDLFRRALTLGLSGIFTTEEAFRRALGDTLPRDWVDFAVDQSERTRAEFSQRVASEMGRVLEQMDLGEILKQTLSENRIEIKAEIRLVPAEEKPRKGRSKEGRGKGRVSILGGGSRS